MPTLISPNRSAFHRHGHGASVRPSFASRVSVALHHVALTRRLSEGADPDASPELELCARRLISRRRRQVLSRSLRRSIEEAERPSLPHRTAVPLRRRAILDARDELEVLANRLADNGPVSAQGMALVDRMATDGNWSPLYVPGAPGALRRLAVLTTAALDPVSPDPSIAA